MALNSQKTFDNSRAEYCETKLEIYLKVSELRNADFVGQSDPFCVVYVNNFTKTASHSKNQLNTQNGRHNNRIGSARHALSTRASQLPSLPIPGNRTRLAQRQHPWELVGRTDVINNTLNASFPNPFKISYFFERSQQIAIDVYDADGRNSNLLTHDYLGSAEFSISALIRAKGQCLKLPLRMEAHPTRQCGFLTVIGEESVRKRLLKMDVGLTMFKRPCMMGSFGGPFLVISRRAPAPDNKWMRIYQSKSAARRDRAHNAARWSFMFDAIRESFERISLGRQDTQLRFEVLFTIRLRDRVVAAVDMSLAEWISRNSIADLFDPDVRGRGEGAKPKGQLTLRSYEEVEEPQFVDYIMGGCEISLVIGIDFTASNGDSLQPNSLHFCDQFHANEYELAIRGVGDILAEYDSDNCFPAYGFGAKTPPDFERVSHCFALTGASDPICYRVDGVLTAYRKALYNVRLSGPTEFSLLIQTAARHAEAELRNHPQAYTILLIVTDGVINDLEETTQSIVEASRLPLSIVIIGVGDADFSAMDLLDGDEIPLSTNRCRDIVQFVPFRLFQNSPDMLVSKVLEEIPNQLVQYFTMQGIQPNPPSHDVPNGIEAIAQEPVPQGNVSMPHENNVHGAETSAPLKTSQAHAAVADPQAALPHIPQHQQESHMEREQYTIVQYGASQAVYPKQTGHTDHPSRQNGNTILSSCDGSFSEHHANPGQFVQGMDQRVYGSVNGFVPPGSNRMGYHSLQYSPNNGELVQHPVAAHMQSPLGAHHADAQLPNPVQYAHSQASYEHYNQHQHTEAQGGRTHHQAGPASHPPQNSPHEDQSNGQSHIQLANSSPVQ